MVNPKELKVGDYIQSENEVFGVKKMRQWRIEEEDMPYIIANPENYFLIDDKIDPNDDLAK